jgi:hypothetical protein
MGRGMDPTTLLQTLFATSVNGCVEADEKLWLNFIMVLSM